MIGSLDSRVKDNGLTTIEEVRRLFDISYDGCHIMTKIQLKAWKNHSESRHKNNNKPFTFDNYTTHLRDKDCLEQVKLDIIDCSDIGGKDTVISYLLTRIV
jgi:hypothetical protein